MISTPIPSLVETETTPASATPSGAMKGGIVGGIVSLLAIIAIVGYLLLLRRRQAEKSNPANPVTPFYPSITPQPAQNGYDEAEESQLTVAGLPPSWRVAPFMGSIGKYQQSKKKSGLQSSDVPGTQGSHAPGLALESHPPDNIGATSSINSTPMVDMQTVFQDRRFEGHLLRFIMQRINSRGGHDEDEGEGSVAPPPTYREAHSTS